MLSVKTGGCEEDCAYCSQSIHNSSDVTAFEAQMQVEPVLQRARAAKEAGADRFCMGWAWREIRDGAPFEAMLEICLLYTSPSPRDLSTSRMPSSA